jgi:ectoine hydroxylase-related dioxygenase (phytanoyl-CoA dioxygenase family)
MEHGVLDAFAKVWGTDELLVSFDSLNVTLPNLKPVRAPWPHIDQAPRKRGLHCVQGIINLSHAGPEDGSLVVIPGSQALVEEFFDTKTDPATWEWKDNRYFSEEDMAWFRSRGLQPIKVLAEPGDLILWDSRTIHWGGEPTSTSETIRTVIYAAYAPAKMASTEALTEKEKVFDAYGATTHWPHDNIKLRELVAPRPDGTIDPRNRNEPLEKPERTDRLLKLAGLKAY